MKKKDKQEILLQHNYSYLEHYKGLRIKIPIVICGIEISVMGFILSNEEIISSSLQKFLIVIILLILGVGGLVTYQAIHEQYEDILDDFLHVYKKMGIAGEDYFPAGKEPSKHNNMFRALKIWRVGYWSLGLVTVASTLLMYRNELDIIYCFLKHYPPYLLAPDFCILNL